VVQQVNKEWDVNKDTMDAYVTEIRKLENKPWGRVANKGNFKPRHHVYAIDYYFQPRTDSILRLKSLS
jgi:hypothetical protein